jgi:phosphate transport system protein
MTFASHHTSRAYESELEELRRAIITMGDLCRRALGLALDAFRDRVGEPVAQVQDLDGRIDASEMAIDALVVRIMALRQPVASDLRFLAMALKLVTDLERIGDEAVNIAERAVDEPCAADAGARDLLGRMAEEAQRMVATALEAFIAGDTERAREVLVRDDVVDELYGRALRSAEDYMARHPREIQAALAVMSVAKYLERVADHATNIAEEVIFVVRGVDVRHGHSTADVGGDSSGARWD